jgi:hypothetical protein
MEDEQLELFDEVSDDPEVETPDAGSRSGVNKAREKARLRELETLEFWRAIMGHPTGRGIVWGLLQDAGTFEERFATGPNGFPQVEATWFHAGQQAFGLRLYLHLLKIVRSEVATMHDELDPRFSKVNIKMRGMK